MSDKEKEIGKLLKFWKKRKADIRPPVSEDALMAFETKYRVQIPEDLRFVLRAADGMEYHTSDNTELMFCFWQLDRILPAASYFRYPGDLENYSGVDLNSYYCFADYMIEAEIFMIRLSNDPKEPNPVVGWKGAKKAKSFLEFVTKYLDDPDELISK